MRSPFSPPHLSEVPEPLRSGWSWPHVSGKRLLLKQPTPGYLLSIHEAMNTPGVLKYFLRDRVQPLEATERYFYHFLLGHFHDMRGLFPLIVEKGLQNRVLGVVGLFQFDWRNYCCELGIWIRSDEWGKGICQEASQLMLETGFRKLQMERIEILIEEDNRRSQRAFEKLGAVHEGILRRRLLKGRDHLNMVCMSILRDEFKPPERE